ncbi:hypothetical protein FQR65_LT05497 [Abscondita terminalis]|nr:hypothetical protein FQR65_LT05497 [Abscondita terminalis]
MRWNTLNPRHELFLATAIFQPSSYIIIPAVILIGSSSICPPVLYLNSCECVPVSFGLLRLFVFLEDYLEGILDEVHLNIQQGIIFLHDGAAPEPLGTNISGSHTPRSLLVDIRDALLDLNINAAAGDY